MRSPGLAPMRMAPLLMTSSPATIPKKGRLAAAGRTNEDDEFANGNVDRNPADGFNRAVQLAHVFNRNAGHFPRALTRNGSPRTVDRNRLIRERNSIDPGGCAPEDRI